MTSLGVGKERGGNLVAGSRDSVDVSDLEGGVGRDGRY